MQGELKRKYNYYNLVKNINVEEELNKRGFEGRMSGENLMLNCPFHDDENPSFGIRIGNEKKGIYNCRGCGQSGNFFNLISYLDNITFDQAVNKYQKDKIDSKYLIELKTFFENNLASKKKKKKNKKIKSYKKSFLNKFKKPYGDFLEYLCDRKINDESIEKFNILCCDGKGRGYASQWEDRIIIPVVNKDDKLISCTARHIYDNDKKNKVRKIKDSESYKCCFGLKWIKKGSPLVLVEGEFDMIYLQQFHIPAICVGKFPSKEQIEIIINFDSDEVALSLDGDVGWKAKKDKKGRINEKDSLKYIKKRLSKYMKIEVIKLPRSKDPNELSKEEVKKYYKNFTGREYFS